MVEVAFGCRSRSSLDGDYSFSVLEDLFDDAAEITGSLATGTLSFDGAGGATISVGVASVSRTSCLGGDCFSDEFTREPDLSVSDSGT